MTAGKVRELLASDELALRYGAFVRVLGGNDGSEEARRLRGDIKRSTRVLRLLAERGEDGKVPGHPYEKWYGAHWVLCALAELGYPPGDEGLVPMREQVLTWLLSPSVERRYKRPLEERTRICGSIPGNAIYYLLALELADERVDLLVERLLRTQWPDGGWNCDRRPEASIFSFDETWLPLRSLALYAKWSGSSAAREAADRAADVFLSRKLFKRRSDGEVIKRGFVQLHYPPYWHYDIPAGLKAMAEAGYIRDERCRDALDLLMAKQLTDGGFAAEGKYYNVGDRKAGNTRLLSVVDWGPTDRRVSNPFVTLDALAVLRAAGRLSGEAAPSIALANP